jgi:hypothetical protein
VRIVPDVILQIKWKCAGNSSIIFIKTLFSEASLNKRPSPAPQYKATFNPQKAKRMSEKLFGAFSKCGSARVASQICVTFQRRRVNLTTRETSFLIFNMVLVPQISMLQAVESESLPETTIDRH